MTPTTRIKNPFSLVLLLALVAAIACSSASSGGDDQTPTPTTQPVSSPSNLTLFTLPEGPTLTDVTVTDAPSYLFLFTHTEDQFNYELSDERFWRVGAMIEDLAAAYPDLDITWTIEFQGADAKATFDRNDETGLVDYLLSLKERGLVEFGYHAHHDPTYENRPQNDLPAVPTYDEAYDALWTWITCEKDPVYGGCVEERGGGLEAILNAFGQVELVTGFGISEGFQAERSAGSQAVRALIPERRLGFGFPDHGALARDQTYVAARDGLLALLTPTHETSSGTFWMDNSLRINDSASLEGVNANPLREGADLLKQSLDVLDGNRSFVINIGIADKYLYTVDSTSPTKWAYVHPEMPELPEQYLQTDTEREKRYAFTEQSIDYLAQTVAENPQALKFVDADQVVDLFTSDDYWNVDANELEQIALWTLNDRQSGPPNWVYDGEDFYSLADAFALLAAELGGSTTDGIVSNVYGPWSATQAVTSATSVSVDDLRALVANGLIAGGRIQEVYIVGGQTLTATQLLYALSYLYVFDRHSVQPATIDIPQTQTAPETSGYLEDLGCVNCLDTAWSLKPARFQDLTSS